MVFQSAEQCASQKTISCVIRHRSSTVSISEPIPNALLSRLPRLAARLVLGNLAAWSHGSAVVYASEIYDPRAIVDAVVKERCTALHGVPTHFLGVLAEVERRQQAGEQLDLSRLRFIFSTIVTAFTKHIYQDRDRGWVARSCRTHEATDHKAEPARVDKCVRNEYVPVSCHTYQDLDYLPKSRD